MYMYNKKKVKAHFLIVKLMKLYSISLLFVEKIYCVINLMLYIKPDLKIVTIFYNNKLKDFYNCAKN